VGRRQQLRPARRRFEQAELNLGYTRVVSLVDGIAGINTVQVGNLVGPATVLTAVSQVSPIKVYFPISEQEYLRMADGGSPGSVDFLTHGLTNPVAVNFGRRECLPASGQNHLRGSPSKHADRNHPNRGRVPELQEPVATGPICTHSDAHRKHHGSAAGATGGRESAARNLSGNCGRGRQPRTAPHGTGRTESGHALGDHSGLKPGERVVAVGAEKAKEGELVNPTRYKETEER